MYKIKYSKTAVKHAHKIKGTIYEKKVKKLIEVIRVNPYQTPPTYEKLRGNLSGLCSRRINREHRLVYEVNEKNEEVLIFSMWSHYEEI